MSSVAYNLTRKLEWMGRRLRHIDEVAAIKAWIAAMKEINSLLKEVDIKECSDTWKPWSKKESAVKSTMPTTEILPPKDRGLPPRVQVDGDDIEMLDPKAAVMEMLGKEKKRMERKETKKLQGELSLIEKKRNREIWRKGMLDRVKKEKFPFAHWGTLKSDNFKIMIAECAPHAVRVAVIEDMGFHEVDIWLYQELLKFYEKGKTRNIY